MDLLIRCLIYLFVMFLITIVYAGQYHDTARATVQDAAYKTGKFVGYTVLVVLVMELSFLLFID